MPHLRPALPSDAPAITALTHAAYAKWLPLTARPPLPMRTDYAEALRHHRFDLLEENTTILALLETTTEENDLLIINLATHPAHQRQGHARTLLAHAEALARAEARPGIRLFTNKLFAENIALYARHGFAITHEQPLNGGTAVHMRKPLPA